jgi:hypothetical protein
MAAEPGFIWSRGKDLFFFFGSGLVAAAAGVLGVAVPATIVPMWWAWILLLEGPHLAGTFARTYFDPDERARRGPLLRGSLLWFLPGPLLLVAGELAGTKAPFELFLGFAALWSLHHGIRQSWGIAAIYDRLGGATRGERLVDFFVLHGVAWLLVGLWLVEHPANRGLLGISGGLPPALAWVPTGGRALVALVIVLYTAWIPFRTRGGRDGRAALAILGPTLGLSAFTIYVIGPHEPTFASPQNPEQLFLTVTLMGGVLHGLQYLGIYFGVSARRFAAAPARSFAARLGSRPLFGYGAFVAMSVGYVALSFTRAGPPGALFAWDSLPARLLLALYWGLFFHHYYLDQKIWKPGKDGILQRELGLVPTP